MSVSHFGSQRLGLLVKRALSLEWAPTPSSHSTGVMGAAATTARYARPPERSPPPQPPEPERRISPAAGVAVAGPPPPPGASARGPLYGMFGARSTRMHLETTISSLVNDLSAAKARVASVERDLHEAAFEAAQQGIPRTECVVCMAACVSTVLLPCGHLCLCMGCATSMQAAANSNAKDAKPVTCPLCRLPAERMQRVFLPVDEPKLSPPRPPPMEELPDSPVSAGAKASPDTTSAADAGVQVSPSLRRDVNRPRFGPGEPAPRVSKRLTSRPALELLTRGNELISARNEDDIIMRPPRYIVRPPSFHTIEQPRSRAAPTTPVVRHVATEAGSEDVVEVRGSPEERPGDYDFVLPGSFVPDRNPAFAATWDGALRIRS